MPDELKIKTGYYDILRPEILSLIPQKATSILDLGCGTGRLGKALKDRQLCTVEGIELNKEAAGAAHNNLDKVYHDNLNRFDPAFLTRKYDVLVFADILEHLLAPWMVLKKFTGVLNDNGTVVASIPNIAHPWIISQLQKGLFRYELAGLLDVTHLRFFTKTTIGQLFYKAGLKITKIDPHPHKNNPIQYLVTATKKIVKQPTQSDQITSDSQKPLVTILLLTLNAWKFTAQCIKSIREYTTIPYKILVIDNGSTDGTIEKLRRDESIYHIENDCNLGFARGFNIGLELIDTPYFIISNNDVVVTQNWLKSMIEHINDDNMLMGLGPRSNHISGPQLVKEINYDNIKNLQKWARSWADSQKEIITYFHRLAFFFVLFKSEILNKIGLLDERFEIGNFEDDDYCLRVVGNKYRLAIDNTVFIHHYGSQTFKANKLDYAKVLQENKVRFMQKWGIKHEYERS